MYAKFANLNYFLPFFIQPMSEFDFRHETFSLIPKVFQILFSKVNIYELSEKDAHFPNRSKFMFVLPT